MAYKTLSGSWKMRKCGDNEWNDATVPGSVMNDYLQNGIAEDPYIKENEKTVSELFEHDFEYRKIFRMTNTELAFDQVELVCYGLDTLADIWVNNKRIGKADNMHRTWRFNLKGSAVEGENEIRIVFHSPIKYINSEYESHDITYATDGNMHGTSFLRKAHCQFGWDWGLVLPDAGIWREIGIESYSGAKFENVYIRQVHKEGAVQLDIRTRILFTDMATYYKDNYALHVDVSVVDPFGKVFKQDANVVPGDNHIILIIDHPYLWWPNGFGEQPLYEVQINLMSAWPEGDVIAFSDNFNCRIGLREMTISQMPDKWGEEFALKVNGIKIFSMGADYIPEDAIIPRCNKERTRRLLEDCVKANYNSIRVWGGAYYPDDYFYDVCDELGLVVWQDLMFACNVYDLTDEFASNISQEIRDNMRRIRHHACLGLWCGNNEMELGWVDWDDVTNHSLKYKADYIRQFEELLPHIAKEEDPDTFYWRASPSSTGAFDNPNSENIGDVHYWDVWHGLKPFTDYRKYYFRYCSEFGFQSMPDLKTIHTFADEQDLNLFSPVMEGHQKRTGGNGKILYYISETYRYPKDFRSLIFISQILQMEANQYGVEHWRRNRGRCMGAIYWQLNDNWPVISWSSIDYYGRWKALHYGARRFFAPVMVSILNTGTKMTIYSHNESLKEESGKIVFCLMNKNLDILWKTEKDVTMPPLSARCEVEQDFSDFVNTLEMERSCYVMCSLEVDGKVISRRTALFTSPKYFSFDKPVYKVKVIEEKDTFTINVKSNTYSRFVEIQIQGEDVVFSDNYVDLIDKEGIDISVDKKDLKKVDHLQERIRLFSVADSYI